MPIVGIGQHRGPTSPQHLTACHTTNASKVDELVCEVLSDPPFTWPLANRLPLLQASQQLFAGKIFNNQQKAENTFQEFIESWSTDFYATGISKLISHWKNVLIIMIHIFIKKDVFEPSYSDLKFMVWNHNYFCTNLITMVIKNGPHQKKKTKTSGVFV